MNSTFLLTRSVCVCVKYFLCALCIVYKEIFCFLNGEVSKYMVKLCLATRDNLPWKSGAGNAISCNDITFPQTKHETLAEEEPRRLQRTRQRKKATSRRWIKLLTLKTINSVEDYCLLSPMARQDHPRQFSTRWGEFSTIPRPVTLAWSFSDGKDGISSVSIARFSFSYYGNKSLYILCNSMMFEEY